MKNILIRITLSVAFALLASTFTLLQFNRISKDSKLLLTPNEMYKCISLEELFGREGVLYFSGDEEEEDSTSPFLFAKTKPSMVAEIPLIPFDDIIFPNSRDFLHVTDMRFRFIFQKVEEGDDMFGRCFLSQGKIGAIGCLCKIIERRKAENGERMYIIEAVDRFRIRKITQSNPFLKAEVEIFPKDKFVAEDVPVCEQLCTDIYFLLQVYIRLTRLQSNRSPNSEIVLTSGIYENRPRTRREDTIGDDGDARVEDDGQAASRHEQFSNACAGLLSTEKVILQQLLQSRSTRYRLTGIKSILVQAVGEIGALLGDEGLLSPEMLRDIEAAALAAGRTCEDAVATEGLPGPLTLAALLGDGDDVGDDVRDLSSAVTEGALDSAGGAGSGVVADPLAFSVDESMNVDFDSVWENPEEAFQ